MKRLAIIGAGELGLQIAHLAEENQLYIVAGFLDDFANVTALINGKYPVIGRISDLEMAFQSGVFDEILVGIGYNHLPYRKAFFNQYHKTIPFGTIISKGSFVDSTSQINSGCIIYPGGVIDKNVLLENNVILHIGCHIAHDTVVQAHSYIGPSTSIAGFVNLGECCYLGIRTTIIDHITICNNVQTGGGSLIVKNISMSGLYVGSPTRKIK